MKKRHIRILIKILKRLLIDIIKIDKENSLENIEDSPAFPGSMLTAVWKKK